MAKEPCSPRFCFRTPCGGWGAGLSTQNTRLPKDSLLSTFSTGKAYFFQSVIMQTTRAEAASIAHQPALQQVALQAASRQVMSS